MELDDIDDPVIYEVPVHFTSEKSNELYLTQYPLKPSFRPVDVPVAARFKPNNSILQLDVPIIDQKEHFDADAESYLKQKVQVLESTAVPPITNYAVGVYRDGQLHITPVRGVLQMRPSFAHIDNAAEEAEGEDCMDDFIVEDDAAMEVEEETKASEKQVKEEAKQVQMVFKRQESEKAIERREKSYAHKRSLLNAEKWTHLPVFGPKAPESEEQFERLFSELETDVEFNVEPRKYMEALRDGIGTRHNDSTRDLKDLDQRLLRTLQTDKVVSFETLCQIDLSVLEETILEKLDNVAMLLHGNFVAKSELIEHLNEGKKNIRDAVLCMLHAKPLGISRMVLANGINVRVDELKPVLEEFADLNPVDRTWNLKNVSTNFKNAKFASTQLEQWKQLECSLRQKFKMRLQFSDL